ncbi:MAG: prolyl oligopeptidase family serine peptidase [Flavobacteriaceae bacterium]|nr:prolyl oligopeptidase family serine peptidase [Flavobacteriaceae bacterium]
MKTTLTSLFICLTAFSFAQKKILSHSDKEIWNAIKNETLSPNGNYIMYSLERGEKDNFLKIKDSKANSILEYDRGQKGQFSYDSKFAFFTIKPWKDSINELKRKKVKKDKLTKDSLGIFNLNEGLLTKIANIKSYKIPEKWSGYVAYYLEEVKSKKKDKKDSSEAKTKKKEKIKKVGKDNGYHLILRSLTTQKQDTFKFVTNFSFAKEGKRFAFSTTGEKDKIKAGVYVLNLDNNSLQQVYHVEKAKYYQVNLSESGKNLAFVVDTDTTKAQIRPYELYHWSENNTQAEKLLDTQSSPKGYRVSSDGATSFSKDESKLYFGLATPPIVKDTTLIDDEIVNVEVWTYDEPRLYTVQELQVKNDKKKSYQTVIHLNDDNKLVQLATTTFPNTKLADEGNGAYALVDNPEPHQLESQWDGLWARDYAAVDSRTGDRKKILTKIAGNVNLSPKGNYAFGYSRTDSTWFAYNIKTSTYRPLTKGAIFYNEIHDAPTPPYSYGNAGWTKDDRHLILYDRYDLFKYNPDNAKSTRLTKGRETKTVYRYLKIDEEERFLDPTKKWLLSTFNEDTKEAGYFELNPKTNKGQQLVVSAHRYNRPKKSQLGNALIFTRESFQEFPDLHYADLRLKKQQKISNANPQQEDYNWGTIEQIKWTSLDGKELTGMLVKPENFDPKKKYPMIVNFYEKSSNGLHRHRAPTFGRSTINYSYYVSNGYIIFNPDVYYREGYPGESAYNCVIPGVTSLIEKGFVDKDNIGVQGHSWGGYQIAYLVTKTDIFKAAEAGAPVPNMISAYGGIRWWTGLSRQFQYEHTQSRIGGTPWEYPARYIENSPIFNIDKINTPLLIMHNDADGHVPWYQGIEFFVALRRLGKPSWFLNYNEEPHWPVKFQNRKDFNIRLSQFFDHYLKGAPKPIWMDRGVPAIEKGINQGLELLKGKK